MSSDQAKVIPQDREEERAYEPPQVTVLGTVAELTQVFSGAADELHDVGSQG